MKMQYVKTVSVLLALLLWMATQSRIVTAESTPTRDTAKKITPDNTLTPEQKTGGWQLLFDGKTLEGWSVKSGFGAYKVEDGTIAGTTVSKSPNTFLCSDRTFADFEMTFEVKYDDAFFNSGVQIRSKLRDGQYGGRVYGPQVEIENSPGQSGYIYGEMAGGWQSPEPKSQDPAVNAHHYFINDGWNQYSVRAVGRRIQTWINGHAVADLMYDEALYNANREGLIGLQVHGVGSNETPMTVRWKNIYIRPIYSQDCVSLFNGENFDGWSFHFRGDLTTNANTFTVKDGMLYCSGDPFGYMYTDKNTFSHYTLEADLAFVIPEGQKPGPQFRGNSGVLVHVGKKNALGPWPQCIEVQGMYPDTGRILPIPRNVKCQYTDVEVVRERAAKVLNPAGEWNTIFVDVYGGNMVILVNGSVISTVRDCELTEGAIGLQSEGVPTRWRNIRIRERENPTSSGG